MSKDAGHRASGVIGHYVLLRGAGCYLRTRRFSGRRARPWGRAAGCASGRRARLSGPSGTLRTGGAFVADVARRIALMPSYGCQPAIPHAIPVSACRGLGSDR